MSKGKIAALFSPADAQRVQPVLDALRARRIAACETDGAGKRGLVLLFLSAAFAADDEAQRRFFAADSGGAEIIPVDLDGAAQSELLRGALIARNAVDARGRTPEEIAARIASAPYFAAKKKPLAIVLAAAALLLALGALFWLWRSAPARAQAREREQILSAAQAKYGLSEEDLAEIVYVYIVSDGFYPLREDESEKTYTIFPNHSMEEDGMHWTSHEDGHRIYAAPWDVKDWEVLRLMPNLEGLIIVLADAGSLPDLSALEHLDWMQIIDSQISDIGGLSGSSLTYFGNFRCPVADYSPLTRCEALSSVTMEFDYLETADLSGFSPPALAWASFGYGREPLALDLSGLKNCPELEELTLKHLPTLKDLDCLSGLPKLSMLTLEDLPGLRDASALGTLRGLEHLSLSEAPALRDISALGRLEGLRQLDIAQCDGIRDLSALGGCTSLQALNLTGMSGVTDLAFLSALDNVSSVGALSTPLRDTEYLEKVAQYAADRISLSLNGQIPDVSGLRHIRGFGSILLCADGKHLDYFLPYLEGASGDCLWLNGFSDSELPAVMPQLREELKIEDCRLVDLRGLGAWSLGRILIDNDPALRSLDGVEALRNTNDGTLCLEIRRCPLLGDLSALEGAYLGELTLSDMLTAPELRGLRVGRLRLENITELSDLNCLDGLDASQSCDIELLGLNGLRDLSPLRRFHGGKLTVPPHLAEQAAELVESGIFQSYDVAYPEEGWVLPDEEIVLLSLDELGRLSPSLLHKVHRLCLAGDLAVDPDRYEVWERHDETGLTGLVLVERETGEETPLESGTLTALPDLSALEGLRRLQIYAQGLRDLEGVQALASLEEASLCGCASLEDASALFTLQKLRFVEIAFCPLRSIEGAQNLTELEEIDISFTDVQDLSALLELPALRRVTLSRDMEAAIASLEGAELPFELNIL